MSGALVMGSSLAPELAAVLAAVEALAAVDPVALADGDAVVALSIPPWSGHLI